MRDIPDPSVLLSELVKRPSVTGEEQELLSWMQQFLQGQGAESRSHGRNLVARHGQGEPLLWLTSHIDTYPAPEGYTFDPCSGHITVDGLVLGLGATDAKGSVAAMTVAFLRFVQQHPGFEAGTLKLVLTCDTRSGSEGLGWLRGQQRRPDGVVVGAPTAGRVASSCKEGCQPRAGRLLQTALSVCNQETPTVCDVPCAMPHVADFEAIALGPGDPASSDQPDESLSVEALERAVERYGQIVDRYFHGAPGVE